MSCEDRRFMDQATSSIILKNGHYDLPFRDKDVVLPNYEVAAQRTLNLAKKFKKDPAYGSEYKAFMDNVLCKGYALKMPQEQLQEQWSCVVYTSSWGVPQTKEETDSCV